MPPKKASPTLDSVFIVTYQHSDTVSTSYDTCEIHGVYANLDHANAAAKEKLDVIIKDLEGETPQESSNKEGGLKWHHEDPSDQDASFNLEVAKYAVNYPAPKEQVAKPAAKAKAPAKSKAKKAPTPPDEDEDMHDFDEQEAAPAAKKAAPKKTNTAKTTIPDGKPNALEGLKLLFTGTFDMDRKTCIATAEKYGASVIKKLEDCDYIVISSKAGEKKLEEIQEKGLDTLNEQDFLEMLQTGIPEEKKMQIANRESPEPPKKKAKK